MTYANVAMTAALVFAMSGGAYAAKHYLITSTKQISPSVLKALHGKTGAAGPAGPQGAPGTQGVPGTPGKDGVAGKEGAAGKDGANGVSVTSKEVPTSSSTCEKLGGSEFVAAESKKTTACNGKEGKEGKKGEEGSPWTAKGVLPKGSSETGQWLLMGNGKEGDPETQSVSFAIQLEKALDEHHVHYIKENETPPAGCKGTVEKPEAESGNMCVFTALSFDLTEGLPKLFGPKNAIVDVSSPSSLPGAGTTGAALEFEVLETSLFIGQGTWVVTG